MSLTQTGMTWSTKKQGGAQKAPPPPRSEKPSVNCIPIFTLVALEVKSVRLGYRRIALLCRRPAGEPPLMSHCNDTLAISIPGTGALHHCAHVPALETMFQPRITEGGSSIADTNRAWDHRPLHPSQYVSIPHPSPYPTYPSAGSSSRATSWA